MTSEFSLRSGHLVGRLDADGSVLVLACERHVTEQAVPLHWPNIDVVIRDFLDHHEACQGEAWSGGTRQVADSFA